MSSNLYPNGRCGTCGFGLSDHGACYNIDCGSNHPGGALTGNRTDFEARDSKGNHVTISLMVTENGIVVDTVDSEGQVIGSWEATPGDLATFYCRC